MERIHVPKLIRDQIGMWNVMGWYLQKHEANPSKDVVVYQCQFGHGSVIPTEAAINRDGTVDPQLQCYCLKFQNHIILDNWPDWFYKLPGKEEVTKLYGHAKT